MGIARDGQLLAAQRNATCLSVVVGKVRASLPRPWCRTRTHPLYISLGRLESSLTMEYSGVSRCRPRRCHLLEATEHAGFSLRWARRDVGAEPLAAAKVAPVAAAPELAALDSGRRECALALGGSKTAERRKHEAHVSGGCVEAR